MKKRITILSLLLCLVFVLSGCKAKTETTKDETPTATPTAAAEATAEPTPAGEPIVIKWGHNWTREMDTTFVDPVTGQPALGEEELNARKYAEQQVLEKLNVKIEFVQYPTDLTECILQSVLAGDPIADIVRVTNGSQGQVLAQNVLQPIDEYADLFSDPDDAWMYWGKVYGHNYFLNNVMRFGGNDLMCYNIGI
jgi:ABC-type glycerol-3-phosphate transport system substrate-binding protein